MMLANYFFNVNSLPGRDDMPAQGWLVIKGAHSDLTILITPKPCLKVLSTYYYY